MINVMITVSKAMVAIQVGLFVLLIYAVAQWLKEKWVPKANESSEGEGNE
ncbi:hypothetical protein [Erysipelothrix anatis]|nr:hypothetical protein [Erysipelothrix anatis]